VYFLKKCHLEEIIAAEQIMLISDLQNRVRALVRERIEKGELTGTELANRIGLKQAHISNFLGERRGLSIEAMDRVMEVMRIDVRDLLPEERRKMPQCQGGDAVFDSIPVVTSDALLQSDFGPEEIVEFLRFKKNFLRRIRPEMANQRMGWQRFVLIKADKDSGEAMRPRLLPGATMLIDRHYNSLRSYRRREANVYVVKSGTTCRVRYVELQGEQLTLRPENQKCSLGYIAIDKGRTFADYVVGRVAHIAIET
jgi:transcriptional regulator with XRE-family HTH domain